jgi:hypothetical protein
MFFLEKKVLNLRQPEKIVENNNSVYMKTAKNEVTK